MQRRHRRRYARHLLGVRVTGVDAASKSFRVGDVNFVREIITVEVYLAAAPEDPERSAALAPPWSTLPWPVLVLMEETVSAVGRRSLGAWRRNAASRGSISCVTVRRTPGWPGWSAQFEREGFRPAALRGFVSESEARGRWTALAAFHRSNGHFLVTNGPYRLKSWTPRSVTLEAFRDLSYPLGVGSYDAYAIPRRGFITRVDWDGGRLTLAGDIEVVEKFQRSYRLVRTPISSVPSVFLQRAVPECRYVVVNSSGHISAVGAVPLGAGAAFQLDLTDRLPPGRYRLSAVIAVNGNVMNADVHRMEFVVTPQR